MGIASVLRQVYTSLARRAAGAVVVGAATPKPSLKRPWQTTDLRRTGHDVHGTAALVQRVATSKNVIY